MNLNFALGPAILILCWQIVSMAGIVSPIILPSPYDVLVATVELLFVDRDILPHIGLTLYRTLVSFTVACILGIPIGLVMGFSSRVYQSLEFLVDFFRSIPPITLFPLFLLTLGIGEGSKLGVPIYGCTLVIIVNSVYGVLNVPSMRRFVGKVYGLTNAQILLKIVIPDSLPQVFVGMRTALSLALVLTIVVEMFIGSESGLGKVIYDYHLLFDTPEMYSSIIITGMMGYFLNISFVRIESRLIHWADK